MWCSGSSSLDSLGRCDPHARGLPSRDFLLGIEQSMHGNAKGAAKRLERVLAEDPENATARMFYAEALAGLGRIGEAHTHHVQLERGFRIESRRQQLALVQTLLEGDRAAEAVPIVSEVVRSNARDVDAHRLLLRAQLSASQPLDAAHTATTLARLLPDGPERQRVRGQGARAFALAARVRLSAGDAEGARALVAEAARCDPDESMLTRLAIQVAPSASAALGAVSPETLLIGDDSRSENTLMAAPPTERAAARLASLVPRSPFSCGSCGAEFDAWVLRCPHCGARGSIVANEPDLLGEIDSPVHVLDAIEENRAHVRRLLDRVADGDREAVDLLVDVGSSAVEETLTRAVERGPHDEVFVPVLERMGPAQLAALFAAYERRKGDWLTRFGEMLAGSAAAGVVGRVVQSYGREALPQFEALLDGADRAEIRKVIVDYYIGLADQVEFRKVLERFPLVEVVRRLDETPSHVLRRFLATVEPESFQAEVLLLEPGFQRDSELFRAIASDGAHGEVLEDVLRRRPFRPDSCLQWIDHLVDPVLGETAIRLLDAFRARALESEIAIFADLDRPEDLRACLRNRVAGSGQDAVEPLCDCLGATPSPLDGDVVDALTTIGDVGVDAMLEAYRQGSMLEKFARPLVKRRGHRRQILARVLGEIGTEAAARGLRALRAAETDPNLKLRLDQALHRIGDGRDTSDDGPSGEEDHGQAG